MVTYSMSYEVDSVEQALMPWCLYETAFNLINNGACAWDSGNAQWRISDTVEDGVLLDEVITTMGPASNQYTINFVLSSGESKSYIVSDGVYDPQAHIKSLSSSIDTINAQIDLRLVTQKSTKATIIPISEASQHVYEYAGNMGMSSMRTIQRLMGTATWITGITYTLSPRSDLSEIITIQSEKCVLFSDSNQMIWQFSFVYPYNSKPSKWDVVMTIDQDTSWFADTVVLPYDHSEPPHYIYDINDLWWIREVKISYLHDQPIE